MKLMWMAINEMRIAFVNPEAAKRWSSVKVHHKCCFNLRVSTHMFRLFYIQWIDRTEYDD